MNKTHATVALIPSQSVPAGSTVAAVADATTNVDGGVITVRIANGATGPTVQMVVQILVAHAQATPPAAAPAGTGNLDWKVVHEYAIGVAANAAPNLPPFVFGPEFPHIQVRAGGHTGQAVTAEALLSTFNY